MLVKPLLMNVRLHVYRKPLWRQLCRLAVQDLHGSVYTHLPWAHVRNALSRGRLLGWGQLRFLPKHTCACVACLPAGRRSSPESLALLARFCKMPEGASMHPRLSRTQAAGRRMCDCMWPRSWHETLDLRHAQPCHGFALSSTSTLQGLSRRLHHANIQQDPCSPACSTVPHLRSDMPQEPMPRMTASNGAGMRPIVNMGRACRMQLRRTRRRLTRARPQQLFFKPVNASLQDALHVCTLLQLCVAAVRMIWQHLHAALP